MRPAAPRTPLDLPEETPRAGGGQNGKSDQARRELRQFVPQIRVFAGQDAEHDQDRPQAESDRCRRPQHDTDQNRERTHTLRLIYTCLQGRASLALKGIGDRSLQENWYGDD